MIALAYEIALKTIDTPRNLPNDSIDDWFVFREDLSEGQLGQGEVVLD